MPVASTPNQVNRLNLQRDSSRLSYLRNSQNSKSQEAIKRSNSESLSEYPIDTTSKRQKVDSLPMNGHLYHQSTIHSRIKYSITFQSSHVTTRISRHCLFFRAHGFTFYQYNSSPPFPPPIPHIHANEVPKNLEELRQFRDGLRRDVINGKIELDRLSARLTSADKVLGILNKVLDLGPRPDLEQYLASLPTAAAVALPKRNRNHITEATPASVEMSAAES